MEVPVQAPQTVPTASASRASFMLGILPCLSTMPAREAVPTRVPMVSNISIMQKVITRVTMVNAPISTKPWKLNLNRVVAAMSPKGGSQLAFSRDAKGFTWRKAKEPIQWITEAASIPMSTAPFTPFLASSTMTNRPTNRVTTDSTMVG